MKKLLLSMVLCALGWSAWSSEVIYSDNFDALSEHVFPSGWENHDGPNYKIGNDSLITTAARIMKFVPGGDFNSGLYFRCSGIDSGNVELRYLPSGSNIHLTPGNYKVSYNIISWETRDAYLPVSFRLHNQFGRLIEINDTLGSATMGGSRQKQVLNSKKISVPFSVDTESNIYLNWEISTSWGGAILGNIKVESITDSIADLANEFTQLFGISCSLVNNASVQNPALSSLSELIGKWTNTPPTTSSEYIMANFELDEASRLYNSSLEFKTRFEIALDSLTDLLDFYINTKYAQLPVFNEYIMNYNLIKQDSSSVAYLHPEYINTLNSMITGVSKLPEAARAYTYRLSKTLTLAASLDIETNHIMPLEYPVVDDDELIFNLNSMISDSLTARISREHSGIKLDSLDMTGYIKNPNFYTTSRVSSLNNLTFPGWRVQEITSGGVAQIASLSNPVSDTYALLYNKPISLFEQTVNGLPAGNYTVSMRTRAYKPEVLDSLNTTYKDLDKKIYFYVLVDGDTLKVPFKTTSTMYLPSIPSSIKNVAVNQGSLTMGVHIDSIPGYLVNILFGEPSLYLMTNKDTSEVVIPGDSNIVIPTIGKGYLKATGGDIELGSDLESVIQLYDAPNDSIIAYQFVYRYSAEVLEYKDFSTEGTLSENGTVIVNSNVPGILKISYMSTTAMEGNGDLLRLKFNAKKVEGTYLFMDSCFLNTYEPDSLLNGYVSVFEHIKYGDVDNNNQVQAYDAALTLQYSVGLIPSGITYPWNSSTIKRANVDGDNAVTANDAGLILRHSAGLLNQFPSEASSLKPILYSVDNNLDGFENQNADVEVRKEGNNLVFRSYGNLIGLNVKVLSNINCLGSPNVTNKNMLKAFNIDSEVYKLGLASAYAPAEGEVFMTIPILENSPSAINMELMMNTNVKMVTTDLETGIKSEKANRLSIAPNPVKDITVVSGVQKNDCIRVLNESGIVVKTQIAEKESIEMQLGGLAKGIYYIQIMGDTNLKGQTLVKE